MSYLLSHADRSYSFPYEESFAASVVVAPGVNSGIPDNALTYIKNQHPIFKDLLSKNVFEIKEDDVVVHLGKQEDDEFAKVEIHGNVKDLIPQESLHTIQEGFKPDRSYFKSFKPKAELVKAKEIDGRKRISDETIAKIEEVMPTKGYIDTNHMLKTLEDNYPEIWEEISLYHIQ